MLKAIKSAITSQAKSSGVYQKNGCFFFRIETSDISTWALIHGTLIKAIKGETEVFNHGLATLLTTNGISIASAVETAEKEGFLEVPLPSEVGGCTCLQHYLLDRGRSVGISFSMKQENEKGD